MAGEPQATKYIVGWDFPKKPGGTFYRVLMDEFGSSHPGGDYCLVQRSVALCRDNFIASRLAALAEHFGARVVTFSILEGGLPADSRKEASECVGRILSQRLRRRGRRRKG